MKKIFFQSLIIITLLFVFSNIYHANAQTITVPTITPLVVAPVISDYAKDIDDGKKEILTDPEAKNNQKEIDDNEDVEGNEEAEAFEPNETVEPKEAVEPQEAVENENEGEVSEKNSPEGVKNESGTSSESDKQSNGEE